MSEPLELQKLSNKSNLKGSGAKLSPQTNNQKIFETNSSFHVKQRMLRESPSSVFQEIFTSTDKIFISGGGLITRQKFCQVLGFS